MGRRGSLLAQRFSWTRTADRLEELFDRALDRDESQRLQTNVGRD
jgi:hypothetical protein